MLNIYYGKRTGPREAVSIDLLVFARVELIIPKRLLKPICGRGRASTNEKRVERVRRRSIVGRMGGTEGGGWGSGASKQERVRDPSTSGTCGI